MAVIERFHEVLVSSPGKIILHGEHAVVYGKTAIATSVDLRCYLFVSPVASGNIELNLPGMNNLLRTWTIKEITELVKDNNDLLSSLKSLCGVTEDPSMQSLACLIMLFLLTHILQEQLGLLPGLRVLCYSQLPFGAGLGSSAAYSVCVATGLLCLSGQINKGSRNISSSSHGNIPDEMKVAMHNKGFVFRYGSSCCKFLEEDLKLINKWGYEAETLVHGKPSGIDNSISVFGGAIKFKKGVFSQIQKMPNLSILLVYTKVPRSTKRMVASVGQYYSAYPQIIEPILVSIEEIVLKSELVLSELWSCPHSKTDYLFTSLQDMLTINHHLLNALGVGHSSLDKVHHVTLEVGLGSKLTGGGGGGCAFVLIPPGVSDTCVQDVIKKLEAVGFDCWQTNIGVNGITEHNN